MYTRLSSMLFAFALVSHFGPARADAYSQARDNTFDATCEVRKDGDTRKGASGPCAFSHRHGFLSLDLRNGDTYNLTPGNQADHFKDQKGHKVVRTQAGNGVQEFKWDGGKKIVVTFPERYRQQQYGWQPYPQQQHPNGQQEQHVYRVGETPPDLADLVGGKANQADGDLQRRGYRQVNGSNAGPAKFSTWYNPASRRCVTVRTEQARYQSIVQTNPNDCNR